MNFSQPPVNLIMVTYGQPEMCTQNIEKILKYTDYSQYTITVIDNHSLDKTWQEVCELSYKHPQLSGLQTHQNIGYGQACNLGATITQYPIIVFLNSDVYPKPEHKDWLTVLVDELMDNEDVALVAPKLVKDKLIMGAGVVGTNKDRHIRGWKEEDKGQYDENMDVLSVCGAVIAVKREYFTRYGGFDQLYRHYYEEEDLCWKFRYDGLRIRYVGKSTMVHDHMGSCKDGNLLGGFESEGRAVFYQRWGKWMEEDETVYGGK